MVATAGSGQSSMKIKGSLDTSEMDKGFNRLGKKFDGVKGKAKSFGSDMLRVSQVVGNLAKKLILMGVAGGGALVTLASKAPAVAPALAKMQVAWDKITRSLGEALAPAFERVSGWLDKLAVWVDGNKDKIGEVAMKFLDWAEALGVKVWPWIEKIGNWAIEHPGLFAGIVAGLALGPSILGGISAISGLVGTITGATVPAGLLTALGYLAALGGVAYAGYKGAEALVDKAQGWVGMGEGTIATGATDMSGQTLVNRMTEKTGATIGGWFGGSGLASWEDPMNPNSPAHFQALEEIKAEMGQPGYVGPTGGQGMISAAEDRRNWFLQWWDSVWG